MTALLVFTGTAFVGAFLTGYLGDALGRFRIILVCFELRRVTLITDQNRKSRICRASVVWESTIGIRSQVSLLVYILGLIAFVAIAQYQNGRGGDFIGLCQIKNRTASLASSNFSSLYTMEEELEAKSRGRGATMQCGATIYVLLVITGFASSGIKANVVPFGAEQVLEE